MKKKRKYKYGAKTKKEEELMEKVNLKVKEIFNRLKKGE